MMQEAFKTVYQKFNKIDKKFKKLNDRFDYLEGDIMQAIDTSHNCL